MAHLTAPICGRAGTLEVVLAIGGSRREDEVIELKLRSLRQ
jgi:hypothetical protein